MPCARSFSPKSYICIQRHIFMQMVQFFFFFFFQTKKHAFLLYVHLKKKLIFFLYIYLYIVYVYQLNFFLHFSRAGTVHTPGTEACHTCIAFAFYSWLAGRRDVIQAVLQLVSASYVCTNSEHTFSLSLSLTLSISLSLLHNIHTHTITRIILAARH